MLISFCDSNILVIRPTVNSNIPENLLKSAKEHLRFPLGEGSIWSNIAIVGS